MSAGRATKGRRWTPTSTRLENAREGVIITAMNRHEAKFRLGEVVRHRLYPFRGVVFDVDPEFSSSQEWWLSIPADVRPRKDQPFYHLLAENGQGSHLCGAERHFRHSMSQAGGRDRRPQAGPARPGTGDEGTRGARARCTTYVAYVSEQNLLSDDTGPVDHPQVPELFGDYRKGFYTVPERRLN